MQKSNSFTKKLSKRFISINNSIENFFNKINYYKTRFKKSKLDKNNKVFAVIGAILLLVVVYFSMPTMYDVSKIKSGIKNQILLRHNIDVQFNEKLSYGLLPKPHFSSKNLTIIHNGKNIANIKNFKTYISIDRLFAMNYLSLKDIIFKNIDFKINKDDLIFFTNLLFSKSNENYLILKNGNVFFQDENDELLFINKISKNKIFYDFKNFENILSLNNEIFNIPYQLIVKNNDIEKKLFLKFNSKKIRLSIDSQNDYNKDNIKGILSALLINETTKLNYDISKNSLVFKSEDKRNNYYGTIDFKPFYLSANFNYNMIKTKNLFSDESILIDLIKSEIFNNKNLNVDLNLSAKNINDLNGLNKLDFKILMANGNISPSGSRVMWKDDLEIKLEDSLLVYDKEQIYILTKIIIDIKDIDDFYRSFQIPKKYRKKIKKIEFDVNYNLTKKIINFDFVKIDNKSDDNLTKFINSFNQNEKKIINKIVFKNFVNKFFNVYAG